MATQRNYCHYCNKGPAPYYGAWDCWGCGQCVCPACLEPGESYCQKCCEELGFSEIREADDQEEDDDNDDD